MRCAAGALIAGAAARAWAFTGYEDPVTTTTGSPMIVGSDIDPSNNYYYLINVMLGATRFYNNGYLGYNTQIANVEAGHVWNGQESLTNVTSYVNDPSIDPPPGGSVQYDFHATMVGFTLAGLGPPVPLPGGGYSYNYYQLGTAPFAYLTSTAIATSFSTTNPGEFDISSKTFVYGYNTVMQTGVDRTFTLAPGVTVTTHRPVDVVNSSWGFDDATAAQQPTMILDALTNLGHQTVCVAAGNHDNSLTAMVGGPASGFNVIAVAALTSDKDNPPYQTQASFSNAGPNDFYNPATGQTIPGVRAAVSIAAPGTDLVLAAYIGKTGSNATGALFDPSAWPPALLSQLYFFGAAGTSFASPIVAGGAALVVDAGYQNFGTTAAIDGRTVKAVLLNSATKTPGWTNHPYLDGSGVLRTDQGLDWNVGAGALNLNKAYDQYLGGTTDVPGLGGGNVQPVGWDYGHVAKNAPNDYVITSPLQAKQTMTVTLDWFIPRYFNASATADPTTDNFAPADLHDTYFDQLTVQVWKTSGGHLLSMVAESTSPYNNTDQIYFQLPSDGTYAIRVGWVGSTYDLFGTSPMADDYGLAWYIDPLPEPGTLLLLGLGVPLLFRRRR